MGIYSLYATVPWYHRGYHPVHPVVLPLLLVPGGRVSYMYTPVPVPRRPCTPPTLPYIPYSPCSTVSGSGKVHSSVPWEGGLPREGRVSGRGQGLYLYVGDISV
jgi:hypothetical protein